MTTIPPRITRIYLGALPPAPEAGQRRLNRVSELLGALGPRPAFGFDVHGLLTRQEVQDETLAADAVLAAWGGPPPLMLVVMTFAEGAFQADELADLEDRAGLRLYEEQRFPAR